MARNTRAILQHLNITSVMVVGHSMGGMLAARFATQYPDVVERLVLYNPIGLTDPRFDRPWDSTDEAYKRTLGATFQSIRAVADALRRPQPGGVDAGLRELRAHPLLVDA